MNTLQRSLPTAAFGATSPRKVDPSHGRRVMVSTSRGEVIGVSFINVNVQVGGKGVTHDGQFRGPFVGVVDAGRNAMRSNGFLETPLLAARNLGVARHADRMKCIFYVPQTWIKSGKSPAVPVASSNASQSPGFAVYSDEKTSKSKSTKLSARKRLPSIHGLRRSKSAKELTVVDKKLAAVETSDSSDDDDDTKVPRSSSEVQPSRSLRSSPRRKSEVPPRTPEKDAPGASPPRHLSQTRRQRASEEALEIQISTSTTSTASCEEDEEENLPETVPASAKKPKRRSDVNAKQRRPQPSRAEAQPSRAEESSPETYARSVPNVERTGSLLPQLDLDAVAADSASTASSDDLSQDDYDEHAVRHAGRLNSARAVSDMKKRSSRRRRQSSAGKSKGKRESSKRGSSDAKLRSNSEPHEETHTYAFQEKAEQATYHSVWRTENGSNDAATKLDTGSYDSYSSSEKDPDASLFKTVRADDISKPTPKKRTEKEKYSSQSRADTDPLPTDEVAQDVAALTGGSLAGGGPETAAGLVAMGVSWARPSMRKRSLPEKKPESSPGADADAISPSSSHEPAPKSSSKKSSKTSSRSSSRSQKQLSRSSQSTPSSPSSRTQTERQQSRQAAAEKAVAGSGATKEKDPSTAGLEADKSETEQVDQEILRLSRFAETVRGGKFRSAKRRLSRAAAGQSTRAQDDTRRDMEDMALEIIDEEDAASTTGRRSDKYSSSTSGRRSDNARDGTSLGPVMAAGTVDLVRPAALSSVHEVGKVHAWNAEKKSGKSVLKPQSIVQPTLETGQGDEMKRVSSTDLFTTVVGLSATLGSRAAEAGVRAMDTEAGYRRPGA